mgnify:FL=1
MSGIVSAVGSIFTGPEKPAVPDYAAAADKTAQSNLDMARYTTRVNRPTQITPFGTQSWTNSGGFDQAGYDAAMQSYKDSYQPGTGSGGYWEQTGSGGDQGYDRQWVSTGNEGRYTMPEPNRDDFMRDDDWTQTTTLTPDLQAALDNEMALQKGRSGIGVDMLPAAQEAINRPVDYDGAQAWSGAPDAAQLQNVGAAPDLQTSIDKTNIPQFDQQYVNNIKNQTLDYMRPDMQAKQEQLDAQLAAQGITPGSEAYNNAQRRLADQQSRDEYNALRLGMDQANAMYQNELAGNSQRFGQNLAAGEFGNSALTRQNDMDIRNTGFNNNNAVTNYDQNFRNSAFDNNLRGAQIAEDIQRQQVPLNNINALMNGQQVNMPNIPNFNTMATPQGADYLNAANMTYQGNVNNANIQNAYNSNMLEGMFGFGSSDTGKKALSYFMG